MIRFVPSDAICDSILAWAPLPMDTNAITAPTPMMIPNMVNRLRILFFMMLLKATLIRFFHFIRFLMDSTLKVESICFKYLSKITFIMCRCSISVRPELVEGCISWFDKLTTNGVRTYENNSAHLLTSLCFIPYDDTIPQFNNSPGIQSNIVLMSHEYDGNALFI